jgi:hypothetical protein
MKKIYIFIASLTIIFGTTVKAQQQSDPVKVNITTDIDNIGDGHIQVSRTYSAGQWESYQKVYGSNAADMLKREMERLYPAYYLQNWDYKEDAMNRSFTLSFQALGFAKIDDNGNWLIDIAQKNPDIQKLTDRNYAMTTSGTNSYGVLIQELDKINLPAGAGSITQDKNAFGKAIFTYEMSPGRSGARMLFLIGGILLIVASIVFYVKPGALSSVKKPRVKPFTVVSSQQVPAAATPEPPASPNIEKQA